MKKITYWFIPFVLVFLFFDIVCGIIISKKLKTINYGVFGIINSGISSKKDILILGSSKAHHHYDPELLSEYLGQQVINAGVGGYGLFLSFSILKEAIDQNKPKSVILDIASNINADPDRYDKLLKFIPLIEQYESFNEIVNLNSNYNKVLYYLKSSMYNSLLYDYTRDVIEKEKSKSSSYTGLHGMINSANYKNMTIENFIEDSVQLSYFEKIIKLSKENDIKLYIVNSPEFSKFDPDNLAVTNYMQIANESGIDILDFTINNEFINQDSLFVDQLHLNKKGAKLFSEFLAEKILKNELICY